MHVPPEIRIGPSTVAVVFMAALHGIAAVILIPLSIPSWSKAVGLAVLLVSFIFSLRRCALVLSPRAITKVRFLADGEIECRQLDGTTFKGKVLPQTCVFPLFLIVSMRELGSGRYRSLVLGPGAVTKDQLRQVRIWLLWHSEPSAP